MKIRDTFLIPFSKIDCEIGGKKAVFMGKNGQKTT